VTPEVTLSSTEVCAKDVNRSLFLNIKYSVTQRVSIAMSITVVIHQYKAQSVKHKEFDSKTL